MIITSTANATIKQVRKLRDRKERQQSGQFYVEGLRITAEALQSAQVEMLITAPELLTSAFGGELLDEARRRGIPVVEVSREVFETLALKDSPQGIAAVARQRWLALSVIHPKPGDLWVALEEVADPGNLGTILRTADGVGAQGVILLDHCTDPYDPTAMRGSMGAVFSQQLVKASFAEFAAWKHQNGVTVIGTDGESPDDYHEIMYPDPLVLYMGSEREGLLEQHIALCDRMAKIPMVGHSDSLNLAVATAVMLYEIHNQRRGGQVK